jgi:hypothetical protein
MRIGWGNRPWDRGIIHKNKNLKQPESKIPDNKRILLKI